MNIYNGYKNKPTKHFCLIPRNKINFDELRLIWVKKHPNTERELTEETVKYLVSLVLTVIFVCGSLIPHIYGWLVVGLSPIVRLWDLLL